MKVSNKGILLNSKCIKTTRWEISPNLVTFCQHKGFRIAHTSSSQRCSSLRWPLGRHWTSHRHHCMVTALVEAWPTTSPGSRSHSWLNWGNHFVSFVTTQHLGHSWGNVSVIPYLSFILSVLMVLCVLSLFLTLVIMYFFGLWESSSRALWKITQLIKWAVRWCWNNTLYQQKTNKWMHI